MINAHFASEPQEVELQDVENEESEIKVVAGFDTRDSYPTVILRSTAIGSAVSQQRLRKQLCTHTMGFFIVPTCNLTQC